jgi:hypothetical protein
VQNDVAGDAPTRPQLWPCEACHTYRVTRDDGAETFTCVCGARYAADYVRITAA